MTANWAREAARRGGLADKSPKIQEGVIELSVGAGTARELMKVESLLPTSLRVIATHHSGSDSFGC